MREQKHYFRIGVFLMVGVALLTVGIAIFGGGKIFEKTILAETYFAQSVQGLDVGSPVKFRGVKIGEVKAINTVNQEYKLRDLEGDDHKNEGLFIMITIAFAKTAFPELEDIRVKDEMCDLVDKQGMRLAISYIGVTGLAYLEIDFYDAERYPSMVVPWEPKYIYIPSVPNTLNVISDALQNLTYSLTDDFIPFIKNLNATSEQFPGFTKDLNETLLSLQNSLKQVETSSVNFPQLTEQLNETLFHVNQVFRNQRYDMEEAINNMRIITEDLKGVTHMMKEYPSYVVLGNPPKKTGVE